MNTRAHLASSAQRSGTACRSSGTCIQGLCNCREARKADWKIKHQAVKQDLMTQKLAAANAEEQAKMAMFHSMVSSGARMTIPKRQ